MWEVIMDNKINATQKLLKIVKNRKTPVVINKQENSYVRNRRITRSLSYESYSYDSND
jgi:hypothetical protein